MLFKVTVAAKGFTEDKEYQVYHVFDEGNGQPVRFLIPNDDGVFKTLSFDKVRLKPKKT